MSTTIEEEERRLAPKSLVVRRRPRSSPGKVPAVQTARASQFAKPRTQRTATIEEVPEFSRPSAPDRTGSKCEELTDFRAKSDQSARRVSSSSIADEQHGSTSRFAAFNSVNS